LTHVIFGMNMIGTTSFYPSREIDKVIWFMGGDEVNFWVGRFGEYR
jgi:hypothetical protein